ncbi:MAG: hypothetical protein Q9187_008286 [Circinaria calcarea]
MQAEPDSIYAFVNGSAIGSDGAAQRAGYQVPSPRGQADVIKQAWKTANVDVNKLAYVELHGSGTPVGDALETEGLKLALMELGYQGKNCIVGSNKGNIGNAQHASGLVSLIKICKSLQNGVVPAIASLDKLNPLIDNSLPFKFAFQEIKLGKSPVIAISAAGWGGVNSHIVLTGPPSELLKRLNPQRVYRTFDRETLKAPRYTADSPDPDQKAKILVTTLICARDILGQDIGLDTDLRKVGMSSTAYIELIGRIQGTLKGRSLGVTGLMLPLCTPASLAELYCKRLNSKVVERKGAAILQRGSNAVSFVLLPPVGGSCASLHELVRVLPKEATVIALDHPGLDRPGQSPLSIDQLVAHYLDALDVHLTSKKIHFLGASFGGIIAVQASMVLLERKRLLPENIAVVLLDTPALPYPPHEISKTHRCALNSTDSDDETTLSSPTRSAGPPESHPNSVTSHELDAPDEQKSDPSEPHTQRKAMLAIESQNMQALRGFQPSSAQLDVAAIYVAASANPRAEAARTCWSSVLPRLKFKVVEGEHMDVWGARNAPQVVECMREHLGLELC